MDLLPLPVFSPVAVAGNDHASPGQADAAERQDAGFASLFRQQLSSRSCFRRTDTAPALAERNSGARQQDRSFAVSEEGDKPVADRQSTPLQQDSAQESEEADTSGGTADTSGAADTSQENAGEVSSAVDAQHIDSTPQGNVDVQQQQETTDSAAVQPADSKDVSSDQAVITGLHCKSVLLPLQTEETVVEETMAAVEEFAANNSDADDATTEGADLVLPVWLAQTFATPSVDAAINSAVDGADALPLLAGAEGVGLGKALQAWLAQGSVVQGASPLPAADAGETPASLPAAGLAAQFLPGCSPSPALREAIATALQQSQSLLTQSVDATSPSQASSGDGTDSITSISAAAQGTTAMRVQAMTPQQALQQAGVMAEKLAAQIVWMQSQHIQRAEMRLSPENLGPLQIQLDIQRDQASVSVSSGHAQVREWLDAGQFRLRDLLGQSGLQLSSYSVSDHGSHNAQQQQGEEGARQQNAGSAMVPADNHDEPEAIVPLRMGIGLVDNYA